MVVQKTKTVFSVPRMNALRNNPFSAAGECL